MSDFTLARSRRPCTPEADNLELFLTSRVETSQSLHSISESPRATTRPPFLRRQTITPSSAIRNPISSCDTSTANATANSLLLDYTPRDWMVWVDAEVVHTVAYRYADISTALSFDDIRAAADSNLGSEAVPLTWPLKALFLCVHDGTSFPPSSLRCLSGSSAARSPWSASTSRMSSQPGTVNVAGSQKPGLNYAFYHTQLAIGTWYGGSTTPRHCVVQLR